MMPEGGNKGGRGGWEAKEEEGIHRREGAQGRGDAKEMVGGEARETSAWSRVVGCIARTVRSAVRILEYMMDLGDSLVDVLESLARSAASAARAARRNAEKHERYVAAVRRRDMRRLQTSRKRFRPRVTKSGMGRRWQRETPAGGLQQGEPGKGGPPRFFPREGIG
jgi:hypothetical protein